MAKRHWLDPLARRILNAADRIGTASRSGPPQPVARARTSADALASRGAANQGWLLDVNRASAAEWQRLPGCTVQQVDLLLRLQRGGVQLSGLEDLQQLLNLDTLTLELRGCRARCRCSSTRPVANCCRSSWDFPPTVAAACCESGAGALSLIWPTCSFAFSFRPR